MKFHLKRFVILLLFTFLVLAGVWSSRRFFSSDFSRPTFDASSLHQSSNWSQINCIINDEYPISCRKEVDDEIFVPFSFLKKYFEVNGKLLTNNLNEQYFSWQHSYSKVFYPKETYSAFGSYLWFDNYNVESRDRVKYVSAIHGVPVSSQWDSKGHLYPVQIGQFGLSHFSKNLTQGKRRVTVIEDGSHTQGSWKLTEESKDAVKPVVDDEGRNLLKIEGEDIVYMFKKPKFINDLTISIKFKNIDILKITVVLKSTETDIEYIVNYSSDDQEVTIERNSVIFGFGQEQNWKHLVRDLSVDVQKTQNILNKKNNLKIKNIVIDRLIFTGRAFIDEVSICSSAHEHHSRSASDFLVQNQDDRGGWEVKVTRKLANGELVLQPGWYSAMAQGQAISLLSRMYQVTREKKYLKAAIDALKLFETNSSENGVRTYFLDKYIWFEEYPTTPSLFVLNGFIYSLFGLYDLSQTCAMDTTATSNECLKSKLLFEDGIKSMKQLLPLFDSGSGTIYDLRHFSLKIAPNLARWDYHTTHINQLLYLNTILNDLTIQTTAKRWITYMKGKRAAHN